MLLQHDSSVISRFVDNEKQSNRICRHKDTWLLIN